MKLYVTHDPEGTILAIAMQAPDTDWELRIVAAGEQTICEVEVEDDSDLLDEESAPKRLAEIAQQTRVDVAPCRGKLVEWKR